MFTICTITTFYYNYTNTILRSFIKAFTIDSVTGKCQQVFVQRALNFHQTSVCHALKQLFLFAAALSAKPASQARVCMLVYRTKPKLSMTTKCGHLQNGCKRKYPLHCCPILVWYFCIWIFLRWYFQCGIYFNTFRANDAWYICCMYFLIFKFKYEKRFIYGTYCLVC